MILLNVYEYSLIKYHFKHIFNNFNDLPVIFKCRAQKLQLHPKFRAAFDLLAFRAAIEGGPLIPLVTWWQEFQQQHPQPHTQQTRTRDNDPSAKHPRTRRRRHTPHTDDPQLHRHR